MNICAPMEPHDFEPRGFLENALYIGAALAVAGLAAVGAVAREMPEGAQLKPRALWVASIGGVLSGVVVIGLMQHFYGGLSHPFLAIAISVLAGAGNVMLLGLAVNALAGILQKLLGRLGPKGPGFKDPPD